VPNLWATLDHYQIPLGLDGTPYEHLEKLRDQAEVIPVEWSDAYGGHWVVGDYSAIVEIVQNTKDFSNKQNTLPNFETEGVGMIITNDDGVTHKQNLRVIAKAFSPKAIEEYTEKLRQTANRLIDERIELGHGDIASWIADELPAALAVILLGLVDEGSDDLRRWVGAVTDVHNPESSAAARQEMLKCARDLIARRRVEPGDDVFSMVVNTSLDGEPIPENDLISYFIIILLGSIENTARLLASSFWRLAWDVELRRRLVAHPELIDGAVDEFIRFYAPAISGRTVAKEVTVRGRTMLPGQMVMLWHPVANRNRSVFPNPDTFVFDRTPNRHLAFSTGIHRCLGAHLVRMEVKVAIGELLRRIPMFALDPGQSTEWQVGSVSGAHKVPIIFPVGQREGV